MPLEVLMVSFVGLKDSGNSSWTEVFCCTSSRFHLIMLKNPLVTAKNPILNDRIRSILWVVIPKNPQRTQ